MDKYFLASIVQSSDDSIVTVDFDLNVTSWNDAAERLMGYPAADAIGMPLTNLTLPDDFKDLVDNVKKIREGGHVPIYDTERVKQDGEHIFLRTKLSPVMDDDNKVIGVATIARDQTDFRRAVSAQEGERERISLELHD